MTVILGLKCRDGAVLAADSQGTGMVPGNLPTKVINQKVIKLSKHVVYAATGSTGAGQRIGASLRQQASKLVGTKSPEENADVLRRAIHPLQKAIVAEWTGLVGTQAEPWGAIFCGWSNAGPWVFEIEPSGASGFHDPFATTGSGYAFAHAALMERDHFGIAAQPLEAAKGIAYRAIANVCDAAAVHVGLPVQMASVTEQGVEEIFDGSEAHDELKLFVDLWKAKEVEALGAMAPLPVATADLADADAVQGISEAEINP